MNKLTMKDMIYLESMQTRGASPLTIQLAILSRYYNISEQELREMDMKDISSLINGLNEYMVTMQDNMNFNPSLRMGKAQLKEIIDKQSSRFDLLDL